MCKNGLIEYCAGSGCGWKCCSFGSGGHIVILPRELDGRTDIGHLKVIDDDYLGGKKVKCIAKDCATCDHGYKPIMCRSYPLWMRSTAEVKVLRSLKCPLPSSVLSNHKEYVVSMFNDFQREVYPDLDSFLKVAWVDKYDEL